MKKHIYIYIYKKNKKQQQNISFSDIDTMISISTWDYLIIWPGNRSVYTCVQWLCLIHAWFHKGDYLGNIGNTCAFIWATL